MDCFCVPPRSLACRVVLLDERELIHDIQDSCTGQALMDAVFRHLNLLETSYFGLRFVDQDNQTNWLEADKRLKRQLRGVDQHTLYFGVKFYPANPCKLLEEITRYQLFLQVKQDVLRGRLPVNFEFAAELAAFALQSELGDYDTLRHGHCAITPEHEPEPLESHLAPPPHQNPELHVRAAQLHKALVGMSPAAAELSYLNKVKWLDMYGVDLHPVVGEDSAPHYLGLAPSGLLLLRGRRPVAQYYWPRVTRGDRKGRYFMLRVVDKDNSTVTYGFETSSRAACYHLWRCCSEQLAFFRAQQLASTGATAAECFRHSSGSGEGAGAGMNRQRPPPAFTRAPSRRLSSAGLNTLHKEAALEGVDFDGEKICKNRQPTEVPCPVSLESPYRVLCGPVSPSGTAPDSGSSPQSGRSARSARSSRSARSAPHTRRGMYLGLTPSTPPASLAPPALLRTARHRSASVDSQSSGESRNGRKHRHRSRGGRGRLSDAESEVSASHASACNRRHRTSSDTDCRMRQHMTPRHREYSLVDSEAQWREVQRLRASAGSKAGRGAVGVAGVRRAEHKLRKHRKHRSRSSSPDKSWLPSELKEHLEFKLIDTNGMTEAQLKNIPYTVVQTSQARPNKLRHSNRDRHKHRYVNVTELTPALHKNRVNPLMTSGLHRAAALTPLVHDNNHHSNSSSGELGTVSRVSHDHTDSGFGADQDHAYLSERSSDSAKHPVGTQEFSNSNRDEPSIESSVLQLLAPTPAPTPDQQATHKSSVDTTSDTFRVPRWRRIAIWQQSQLGTCTAPPCLATATDCTIRLVNANAKSMRAKSRTEDTTHTLHMRCSPVMDSSLNIVLRPLVESRHIQER